MREPDETERTERPLRVLVTGGAGFVGSHTVDLLVARGHRVTVIDSLDPQVHGADAEAPRLLARHVDAGAIRFVRGDVRDRDAMATLVEGADAVLHLAAAVGVGQSMYQPHHYADVNVGGTALLLDLLANRPHAIRRLVVASSMSLYGEGPCRCARCGVVYPTERAPARLAAGDFEPACPACDGPALLLPTPESKPLHCTSVYAITKKAQEEMAVVFGRAYGLSVVALRYFNIYGPRQSLSNPYTGVAAIFLSRLLHGRPPRVFEDGLQSRDFIHVRDVARANLLALEAEVAGQRVYNVGTGVATTVLDVARILANRLGVSVAPDVSREFRAGDIRHCIADPSRIEAELGFRARVGRDEGFEDLLAWSRGERPADLFERSLAELQARRLVG